MGAVTKGAYRTLRVQVDGRGELSASLMGRCGTSQPGVMTPSVASLPSR